MNLGWDAYEVPLNQQQALVAVNHRALSGDHEVHLFLAVALMVVSGVTFVVRVEFDDVHPPRGDAERRADAAEADARQFGFARVWRDGREVAMGDVHETSRCTGRTAAPDTSLEQLRPTGTARARGLVSSRVSGARVEAAFWAPPAALVGVVERFWVGRWDLRGQRPHTTELLADPSVHLVFEKGRSRVVGVWTRLWRNTLADQGFVRAVKLAPGRLGALLDGPASRFTNRIVPLPTAVGAAAEALEAAVLEGEDETALRTVLVPWLIGRLRPDPDGELARAIVERMRSSPDLVRVEDLARVSGLDVRSLQRLFRARVGAPPKGVLARFRLQEVTARIERGEAPDLARLAREMGYADHAHLSRNFKAAVGLSPRAFAAAVHR